MPEIEAVEEMPRSISPVSKTKVMPVPKIANVETCTKILLTFCGRKNDGEASPKKTNKATNVHTGASVVIQRGKPARDCFVDWFWAWCSLNSHKSLNNVSLSNIFTSS